MMQAGQHNRRVCIQRPENARNAVGESVPTWVVVGKRWARIKKVQGSEQLIASELQASVGRYTAWLRYEKALEDMDTTWRLKLGTRYFDIENVDPVEGRRREFVMDLVEVRPDVAAS